MVIVLWRVSQVMQITFINERLVGQHMRTSLPSTLDPQQFAYIANQPTEDAIATALHIAFPVIWRAR